jgi:hypothetical protein
MRKPAGGGADEPRWSEEQPVDETWVDHGGATDGRFRLAVADLIGGTADEVVLFNDSAVREVVLESEEEPVDRGDVVSHITADGVDVSGFRYLKFPQGLTLYYDSDTRIRIDTTVWRSEG